jgi:hypothetical protein
VGAGAEIVFHAPVIKNAYVDFSRHSLHPLPSGGHKWIQLKGEE